MSYEFRNLYPPFTRIVNAWTKESEIYRNQIVYSRYNAWGNLYTPLLLEPGTYTFSVFVRTAVQRTVHIYAVPNDSSKDGISPVSSGDIVLSASADWQRLSFTFTLSIQRELWLRVSPISNSNTKLYVSAPQLEVGSEMTLFEGYHSTWYVDENGELTHTDFPEVPERVFQTPLPKSVWRISDNYNDKYPYNELMCNIPDVGAFANATNLNSSVIPQSVSYLGAEAFKNTQLINATISQNCTYYDTTFPEDCTINFYS